MLAVVSISMSKVSLSSRFIITESDCFVFCITGLSWVATAVRLLVPNKCVSRLRGVCRVEPAESCLLLALSHTLFLNFHSLSVCLFLFLCVSDIYVACFMLPFLE